MSADPNLTHITNELGATTESEPHHARSAALI